MSKEEEGPSFLENPAQYLESVASQPPSKDFLPHLAGAVATFMNREANPQTAVLYLHAAARHLSAQSPAAAGAAEKTQDVQAEMKKTQQLYEIAEAIGSAVTYCSPRSNISQSGILSVMASLLPSSSSSITVSLSNFHVEFLQACLYAEQYHYAQAILKDTWPRPNGTVSVKQVLRYFYIRGNIHIGCNNWKMAIRSFWTCLSIPGDIVSAIAISAWKKMILVQCLQQSDKPVSATTPLVTPKAASPALGRFLNLATVTSKATTLTQSDQYEIMHMVESGDGDAAASAQQQQPPLQTNQGMGVSVYYELVQAFCRVESAAFAKLLGENETLLRNDGNLGLVKQCQSELLRRHIYQVSRIYSVISLDRLSSMLELSSDQIATLLLQLSIEKAWPIRVQDGVVSFPKLTSSAATDIESVKELIHLTKTMQKLDVAVAASSKYQAFVRKESASSEKSGGPRGVEDV